MPDLTAPALFDLEAHGTPCMVCGDVACTCRAAGTLEAELAPVPSWTVRRSDG